MEQKPARYGGLCVFVYVKCLYYFWKCEGVVVVIYGTCEHSLVCMKDSKTVCGLFMTICLFLVVYCALYI